MLLNKAKKYFNLFLGLPIICIFIFKFNFNCIYADVYRVLKISFVGDLSSGKTAFRDTLCGDEVDFESKKNTKKTTLRTVPKIYNENTYLMCELWDTSGQPKFKAQIIEKHIPGSNFVVIMLDAVGENRGQFDCETFMEHNMIEWMQEIRVQCPEAHVIWAFTKTDLLQPERRREVEQNIDRWANLYRGRVSTLFVSAKEGENMDQFFEVVKRVIREKNLLESLKCSHPPVDEKSYGGCQIL